MGKTAALNLTGDGPILDDPILGELPRENQLALNAKLDAAIQRVETTNLEKIRAIEAGFDKERDTLKLSAERDRVDAVLRAHLDGIPGDGVLNMKAREQLQDLRMSALTGTDEQKDGAWHLTTAGELMTKLAADRRAAGGDGSQNLPELGLADVRADSPYGRGYDFDRMMLSLYGSVKEHGPRWDLEKFSGSPEAEMTAEIAKQPLAELQLAELQREMRPNQRIVPVPAAVMRAGLELAETRAAAVAAGTQVREPTYRRDLLTRYFRPISRLDFLGVMQEVISNDVTISRITGAHAPTWRTETQAAQQQSLTVASATTSPKRLTSMDDISWMRLASADSQFGVIPIVSTELMLGSAQAKEKALYGAAVSNGPTGLGGVTGVLAGVIGGTAGNTAPTLADVLGMVVDIADGDIPVEMLRWITSWSAGSKLAQVLTFATSSSMFAVPLYQSIGPGEAGRIGAGFGTIANYPAALSSQLPTDLNSGSETADDEHAIIAGVFPYAACFDYSTMFLTIDDISRASTGQTRITINSFHDIFIRVAPGFSYAEFKPF